MKNKNYTNREILKVKERIVRVLPNVNDVDIKIGKRDDGQFESLIKVHVPKKKELVASKRGHTLKKCLEKSHQAIIKQIQKVKSRPSKNKFRFYEMDMTA